ncbi:putative poly [ADP-ribose] polymerase 3 [Papaver somniferum]|uniref:putative poly [ADP-ribose] polymerase 3 n=1 Tax=Papaver somniferum TaxID=3469 RepID=UPI000E6FDDB7|nr:putative poly [ADP-ribose] polymerase 3 [Papaver somniferum]
MVKTRTVFSTIHLFYLVQLFFCGLLKVNETRATRAHSGGDDQHVTTRKQKQHAETKQTGDQEAEQKSKKPKSDKGDEPDVNGKSTEEEDIVKDFEEFCNTVRKSLSVEQMRQILKANEQDDSGTDDAVVPRCQDMLFYGPLDKCPICRGPLEYTGSNYSCSGIYSEWSSCTYKTKDPPRREDKLNIPDEISALIKKRQDPKNRHTRKLNAAEKVFSGMLISLSGRLSRTHQYWKKEIQKNGGKVSNTIPQGVACLVVSPAERERGGSGKVTEAMERGIPVVSEAWLIESIDKQSAQPVEAYDVVSDLTTYGKGIPLDKMDPSEEALETLNAELKLYGKRGVYKDTRLQEEGGEILEKDGLLYNCAFSRCDKGRELNDYCIMQLIVVPENRLHLYFKKGQVGDDDKAEERLEEKESVDDAVKEFAQLFKEVTGNEFEPWEREKKIQKKHTKFYPVDMDDGVDVRHGGLGLRQLGIAAAHSKLDPLVANFLKVLCSQEIYRYALMEMGLDSPDLPMGMLTDLHLKRCEEVLNEFIDIFKMTKETGQNNEAIWSDFSQRWFTLMHSTRPFIFRDYHEIADYAAAALETVRDINVASRVVGDMTGSTIDDPLSDRFEKMGCSIMPVDKNSEDYKMIQNYLEKTYEPVKIEDVDYGVTLENVFAVEPSAGPSLDDIKKLPNKVLLWCGSRSSNLLRHLHKGFLPAICSLPVPGYMFGRAIVCSDASAEAARYGFTAVDRPEGFLILAVASLGDQITEVTSPPEDTNPLEEKKAGVKGLGRKKTDEAEHFTWKDDIKVPCGRLISSEHKDSPLEFNEYAAYDPKQVSIRFVVGVKYEGKAPLMDTEE